MPAIVFKVLRLVVEAASALLGILGTYFMSRRYASTFASGLFFSLASPVLHLFGKGDQVREFYKRQLKANRDVPEVESEMILGLHLLFWAFLLQLVLVLWPSG